MQRLQSTEDFFQKAAIEVEILLTYAKRNKKEANRYATFNKSAIILLCTKFETFLENFLEEYMFIHLENSSNRSLNHNIRKYIIDSLSSEISQCKSLDQKEKVIENFILLCGSLEVRPMSSFSDKPKFSYGKHGEKEVKKLLNGFGFEAFTSLQETGVFFNKFNSLNWIRNNIIHEDSTPTLTDTDVSIYYQLIEDFIKSLDAYAIQELNSMIVNSNTTIDQISI